MTSIDPASGAGDHGGGLPDPLRALREAEERYRLATRATDDVIWDYVPADGTVHWNEALTRRFGYAPAGLVTSLAWWETRVHPDDGPRVVVSMSNALQGAGDAWTEEYRFERANGTYADILDRGYIIRDEQGRAVRMIGAMLDRSEHKRAEARPREEEGDPLNLSPQVIWTAEPDGSNIEVKQPLDLFGNLPVPVERNDWADGRLHPDDVAARQQRWRRAIASAEPFDAEFRVRSDDGDYRWMRARAYPRRDESGRVVRWYGSIEDIHDRKSAELQLQQLQDELSQVSQVSAVGVLASALAREINQPLTALVNYMAGSRKLIETQGTAAVPVVAEVLDTAARTAMQAGEIVRRLRDLVAKGQVSKEPVDLAALIHETRDLVLGGRSGQPIQLSLALGPDTRQVMADRLLFQQVLANLFRNAAEAMAGQPVRVITITASSTTGPHVLVRIEDSGPGIPPNVKQQLLSPVAGAPRTSLGTGLSICRSMIEAHGGRLWAEDAPGGGAAFCFTLPR